MGVKAFRAEGAGAVPAGSGGGGDDRCASACTVGADESLSGADGTLRWLTRPISPPEVTRAGK
jgi:hypothetical protein